MSAKGVSKALIPLGELVRRLRRHLPNKRRAKPFNLSPLMTAHPMEAVSRRLRWCLSLQLS